MNIPIYEPQQEGSGIPIYVPQPRQSGGGLGMGRIGGSLLHYVTPKLKAVKDSVVDRGMDAMSKVAGDVIEGKDLKQALTDEATSAKIDLKRKMEKEASKVQSVKSTTKNYAKSALNSLFD